MTKLDHVSRIVWEICAGVKKHETGLIITDKDKADRSYLAESLFRTGKDMCNCEIVEIPKPEINSEEPPKGILERMLNKDVIIIPTSFSMTHTKATKKAANNGSRIITMPTIEKDTFLRAIDVDYNKMKIFGDKLKEVLSVNEIHVETEAGTDLILYRGDRNIINSCGIVESGKVMNIPAGEVFFSPLEGKTEGKVMVDASCAPSIQTKFGRIGLVKKPFRIDIESGKVVDCENEVLWKWITNSKNGSNVAEFAIGTNPKARICGNILEDEKVLGTSHIAFGTSENIGGKVRSDIHLDAVFRKPTIHLEGNTIIKNGRIFL